MSLTRVLTGTAKGNALINGAVIANLCRFAYNHAHAVVDKKALAYFCGRVYLDTRKESGYLRDRPCGKNVALFIKRMSYSVSRYGMDT